MTLTYDVFYPPKEIRSLANNRYQVSISVRMVVSLSKTFCVQFSDFRVLSQRGDNEYFSLPFMLKQPLQTRGYSHPRLATTLAGVFYF